MTQLARYERGRDGMPTWFAWEPSRLLSSLFGSEPLSPRSTMHVEDHDDKVIVTVDLPGVAESDVDVSLEAGVLSIHGKRDDREYRCSTTLGAAIDPDRTSATLDNGVLTVTAWKSAAAKPRRIPIGSSKGRHGGAKRRLFWRRRS